MNSLWRVLFAFLYLFAAPALGQVDVNGDAVPDSLRFEKGYNETTPSYGLVEVLDGDSGSVLYGLAGATANEGFGYRAAYGPDLTGDGVPEVLVSVPLAGCANGPCASRVDLIDPTTGIVVRTHSSSPNEVIGIAVELIGDIDGDTYSDYAIEFASSNPRLKTGIYSTVYSGADGAGILEYPCSVSTLRKSAELGYPLFLPEDVDFDGDVDESDVNIVAAEVGSTGPDLVADIDDSGAVDQFDLEIVVSAQGMTAYTGKALDGANSGFCGHFGSADPCGDLFLSDNCGSNVCTVEIYALPAAECGPADQVVIWEDTLYLTAITAPYCGYNNAGCSVDWEVLIDEPGGGTRVETYSGFSWSITNIQGNVEVYVEYTWIDDDDIACCTDFDQQYFVFTTDANNNGLPDECDDGGPPDDNDGDTYTNFCESVLGFDPDAADSNPFLALDSDGDGLSDVIEACELGTNRYRFDTDEDGVDDYAEVKLGTDPLVQDTDGDTVIDLFDPIHLAGDLDQDGISDVLERARGWDPANPDQDFDGEIDGNEIRRGLDPTSPRGFIRTNSSRSDGDGDGLFHHLELVNGTNPNAFDSDFDTLSDLFETEYGLELGISAIQSDTDGDTVSDGDEDGDGDGLSNFEEDLHSTNPTEADTDGDTLSDKYEIDNFLDPRKPFEDSDGDGEPDNERNGLVHVTIGDHSESKSEIYLIHVGKANFRNPGWGTVTAPPIKRMMRRGRKHKVTLQHISTDPAHGGRPDYDYTAFVSAELPFHVDDPEELLGVHESDPQASDIDYFSHKSAVLYLPFDCGEEVEIDGPDAICINDLGNGQVPAGSLYRLERPDYITEPISVDWSVTGAHVTLLETADPEVVWVGPTDNTALPEQFTLSATVSFPGNEHCGQGNTLQEVVEEIFDKELHLIRVDVEPNPNTHDAEDVSNDVLSILPYDTETFSYSVEPSSYSGDITFTSFDSNIAKFDLGNGVHASEVTVQATPDDEDNTVSVYGFTDEGSTIIGCGVPGDAETGVCGSNLSVVVGGRIEFDLMGLPLFESAADSLEGWEPPELGAIPDIGALPEVGDSVEFRDSAIDPSFSSVIQANPDGMLPLDADYIAAANNDNRDEYVRAFITIRVYDSRGKPKPNRPVTIHSHHDRLQFFSTGGLVPPGLALLTLEFFTDSSGKVDIEVRGDIVEYPSLLDANGQPLPIQAFTLTHDQFVVVAGLGMSDYVKDPSFVLSQNLVDDSFNGDTVTAYPNKMMFDRVIRRADNDPAIQPEDLLFVTRIPIASQSSWLYMLQSLTGDAKFPYDPAVVHSYDSIPMVYSLYDPDLDDTVDTTIDDLSLLWESLSGGPTAFAELTQPVVSRWNPTDFTLNFDFVPAQDVYHDMAEAAAAPVIVTFEWGWELSSAGDVSDIVIEGVYKPYIAGEPSDIAILVIAELSIVMDLVAPAVGSVASTVIKKGLIKAMREVPAFRAALETTVGTGTSSVRNFAQALIDRYPMTDVDISNPIEVAQHFRKTVEGIANESKALDTAPFVRTASINVKEEVQQDFLRLSITKSTNGNRLWEGALSPRAMQGLGAHAAKTPGAMVKSQRVAFAIRDQATMTALRSRISFENIQTAVGNGYNRLLSTFGTALDQFVTRVDDALEAAAKSADELGPDSVRLSLNQQYIGDDKAFKSVQEFEAMRFMDDRDLTAEQIVAINSIRRLMPMPEVGDANDKLVKVVSFQEAMDRLLAGTDNAVYTAQEAGNIVGSVTRKSDIDGLVTSAEINDALRFDYDSSWFTDDGSYAVIETVVNTDIHDNFKIPRTPGMLDGSLDEYEVPYNQYPRTGNGMTASRDGVMRPEWSGPPVSMDPGVTIMRIKDAAGNAHIINVDGQPVSAWELVYINPLDPTEGYRWKPHVE